tara:strand:- start:5313 stop:6053 length:741 start_codon:yes stop_codon:yes gene_type:complete
LAELFDEMGKFVTIPHAIINDNNINSYDLAVYVVLMKHIKSNNRLVFPGLKTIANLTKCSRDRVIKSIVNLELQKWLKVDRKAGGVNTYHLIVNQNQSISATTTSRSERLPPVDVVDPKKNNNKKNIYNDIADEVFEYLINKSGRSRLRKTKNSLLPIIKALKNKYSKEDLFHIIKVKCSEWKNDDVFKKYLHPSTLFANRNIDKYLSQEVSQEKTIKDVVCKNCGSKSFIGSGDRRRCLKCEKKI